MIIIIYAMISSYPIPTTPWLMADGTPTGAAVGITTTYTYPFSLPYPGRGQSPGRAAIIKRAHRALRGDPATNGRAPAWYDATHLPVDDQAGAHSSLPWRNPGLLHWDDPTTHFLPWRIGAGPSWEARRERELAWLHTQHWATQEILMIVGGAIYLMNKNQYVFFTPQWVRCPSCIRIYEWDDIKEPYKTLWRESLARSPYAGGRYDAILFWDGVATWDQRRSVNIDISHYERWERSRGQGIISIALTPEDARWQRLSLLNPAEVAAPARAGRQRCQTPWCRAADRWARQHGAEDALAWLRTHGWIPGDRSPIDMQYNYVLRTGLGPAAPEQAYGVQPHFDNPEYERLYEIEQIRLWWLETRGDAERAVDRWLWHTSPENTYMKEG